MQWDDAERHDDSPTDENGFMDPFERHSTAWTDVIWESNSKAEERRRNARRRLRLSA